MTARRRPGRFGTPTPAQVFGGHVEPETAHVGPPREVHPTPADVQVPGPGVVCRIYVGGALCYSTKRMTLDDAVRVADQIDQARVDGVGLVDFPSAHHERVRIDPEHIRSCEVVRVDAFATRGAIDVGRSRSERAS